MLNHIELEKEFISAIEAFDINLIEDLLIKGVNINLTTDDKSWFAIDEVIERTFDNNHDIGIAEKIIQLLLDYSINIEFQSKYIGSALNNILGGISCCSLELRKFTIKIEKKLLLYGANPNINDAVEPRPVCGSILQSKDKDTKASELLLQHGAIIHIEKYPSCFALIQAASQNKKNLIKLLLDYGADTAIEDYDANTAIELLEINKLFDTPKKLYEGFKSLLRDPSLKDLMSRKNDEERKMEKAIILDDSNDIQLTKEEYQELQILLNPNNPPYLKLGETEEDKYIIYENKITDESTEIYLLTDKKTHKDKKYLYAGNKIDAFVYWCYTNNLLSESVIPGVKLYEKKLGEINYKNINSFITNIIGDKVTTDIFNEEGKAFATSYLTVTHWWYNLHTDFNRLYQDENIKLPRAIKSQEEFDTLMKLLDIRHEQFISGKDFNSNQNKAELEALIEGKEPPKRVVDLSFLEDDNTKTPKEKSNNDTDIIPDDFFKNN